MENEKVIAIIPARGGSKGIKNKNIKLINGLPMIGMAINTLKKSLVFDEIIVTSDDEKILQVAREFGASQFRRGAIELSNDIAMTDEPVLEFLEHLNIKGDLPKYAFMVQCTSPFIEAESYVSAMDELKKLRNGTVFSAEEVNVFLWRKYNAENLWNPINHPFDKRIGRQFKSFVEVDETGGFYGFHVDGFLKNRYRFFDEVKPIPISKLEAIDIDTIDDLIYGEHLFLKNKNKKIQSS